MKQSQDPGFFTSRTRPVIKAPKIWQKPGCAGGWPALNKVQDTNYADRLLHRGGGKT